MFLLFVRVFGLHCYTWVVAFWGWISLSGFPASLGFRMSLRIKHTFIYPSLDSHGICWTYLSPQPKMQSYAIVWNEALVCPGFPHRKNCKDPAGDVGILDGTHHPLKTPNPRNLQHIWRLWATWLSAGDSVTTVVGLVTFTSLDSRWLSL